MRRPATETTRNVHQRVLEVVATVVPWLGADDTPTTRRYLSVPSKHGDLAAVGFQLGHRHALQVTVAALDARTHPTRPVVVTCPHVDGADVVVFHAALRYEGCERCVEARVAAHARRLKRDNTCDMCGTKSGPLVVRYVPFHGRVGLIHTGRCCAPLFEVVQ